VRAFFDTNVVVYSHDRLAGRKQARAIELIESHVLAGTMVISTQVLVESYNALQRAALLSREAALEIVEALADEHVVPADTDSVLRGLRLSQHFQLSHWDGLVVQAALDAGCTTLYTEDMQAGQRFDDLEVVNPFADVTHQARAGYATVKVARKTRSAPAKRRKG
jgi:predicted nucleic acid-binding protein